MTTDIEFSEEVFLVTKETAEAYLRTKVSSAPTAPGPKPDEPTQPQKPATPEPGAGKPPETTRPEQITFSTMAWTGEVPPQKWMNFYTKVLSKFATGRGLKLKLTVEVSPEGGVSKQKIEETKSALRELGLNDIISS